MAVVCLILSYLGIVPVLRHDSTTLVIAYTLAAIDLAIVVVALFVFKPLVPDRLLEQSVEQYWSAPEAGAKVVLVWILLEGAGVLAAVGYLLTGQPVSAIATGLTIVAFWLCGPSVFAKT